MAKTDEFKEKEVMEKSKQEKDCQLTVNLKKIILRKR